MSDPIINGSSEPQFNREQISFGPQGGEYAGRFEGPAEKVRALIPQLVAAGLSGTYVCDRSPLATIEFSSGSVEPIIGVGTGAEAPSLIWELFANEVEKDIMDADIAVVNAVNGTAIEEHLRSKINGADLDASEKAEVLADPNGALLYADILAGVRSFRVNVPTLRVSKSVSHRYPVKQALTNVGRLITTATLASQESIPNTILFDLPSYTPAGGSKPNRVYAWYKKHPQIQMAGGNRYTISQEWEYGLWSTTLHGDAL